MSFNIAGQSAAARIVTADETNVVRIVEQIVVPKTADLKEGRIAALSVGRKIVGQTGVLIVVRTDAQTGAQIVEQTAVMLTVMGAGINDVLTVEQTAVTPIAMDAVISVVPIVAALTGETLIVRAAGINGGRTGDTIALTVTTAKDMVLGVSTDIGRQVMATLFTTRGMIRLAGCSSTGAGIFILTGISATAIQFPKFSTGEAVDMKKWRYSATIIGALATSSQAVGESTGRTSF